MTIPRFSERCYVSTPEHTRTFYGKHVYIYSDKGSLVCLGRVLSFHGKRSDLEMPLDLISDLGVGSFSRRAKPLGLDRIEITYRVGGDQARTVYVIPAVSALTPTWKTNGIVRHLVSRACHASTRSAGRPARTTRPAPRRLELSDSELRAVKQSDISHRFGRDLSVAEIRFCARS
jgi:hypothetical protein